MDRGSVFVVFLDYFAYQMKWNNRKIHIAGSNVVTQVQLQLLDRMLFDFVNHADTAGIAPPTLSAKTACCFSVVSFIGLL